MTAERSAAMRRMLPSIAVNGALPLIAYMALRSHVSSEAVALGIGGAIPVLVTLGGFVRRRRLDPIGVIAVIGFAVALIATVLSGGNSLILKLHDSVISGPLGIAFLISLATRRPLLLLAKQLAERGKESSAPVNSRAMYVLTAMIGAILVVHAAVILTLAVALPTTTFLAVGRPIGWAVLGLGAAAVMWYRSKLRVTAQQVAA